MTDRQITLINVADLACPNDPQGRTYRQINAAKAHGLALGALVEIESGARLFIVLLGRDCDQTPLYWLAAERGEDDKAKWIGGYPEDALTEASPRRLTARPFDLQDIEAWDAFLRTVRVGGALPATFRLDTTPPYGEHVVVEMIVPFVAPPDPEPFADPDKIPLRIAEGFPVPVSARFRLPPFSSASTADFIREIVREVYHHEIDEQLYVAEKRPFAPEHG
jgi:hypothetical protein